METGTIETDGTAPTGIPETEGTETIGAEITAAGRMTIIDPEISIDIRGGTT